MPLETENVQNYPRPPDLESVALRIDVRFAGTIIADTRQAFRVVETHHAPTYYLPPGSILAELHPAPGSSFCEWKGRARYFDVTANGQTARRAAWCYPKPASRFQPLAGHIAFYAGKMDACFVDGIRATPQPGDFYGGWITPNLTGIPKGAPGTEHW